MATRDSGRGWLKEAAQSIVFRLRSGRSAVERVHCFAFAGTLAEFFVCRAAALDCLAGEFSRPALCWSCNGGTSQRGPGWATVAGRKNLSIKRFPGRNSTKIHSPSLTCARVFDESRVNLLRNAHEHQSGIVLNRLERIALNTLGKRSEELRPLARPFSERRGRIGTPVLMKKRLACAFRLGGDQGQNDAACNGRLTRKRK